MCNLAEGAKGTLAAAVHKLHSAYFLGALSYTVRVPIIKGIKEADIIPYQPCTWALHETAVANQH